MFNLQRANDFFSSLFHLLETDGTNISKLQNEVNLKKYMYLLITFFFIFHQTLYNFLLSTKSSQFYILLR